MADGIALNTILQHGFDEWGWLSITLPLMPLPQPRGQTGAIAYTADGKDYLLVVGGGGNEGTDTVFNSCLYTELNPTTIGYYGNISANPLFVDAPNANFQLQSSSPCIDAGGIVPGLDTDFAGNPRPVDGTSTLRGDGSDYDMGAYEYQP
jgi:hypothetical protein